MRALFAAILVLLTACGGQQSGALQSENAELKRSSDIDFIPPDSYASYSSEWSKADKFISEGKPRSALDAAKLILQKARTEKNAPQIVKALLYVVRSELEVGEKTLPELITGFEKDIETAQFPEKNILHSIAAELYLTYFQQNRWRLHNRTEGGESDTDIATWGLRRIMRTAAKHHQLAADNEENLFTIKIELFDEIVIKGTRARAFRPTLFDLIAHRAADFFMNEEAQGAELADPFEVKDRSWFDTAASFTKKSIKAPDEESFSARAFLILQRLIALHLQAKNSEALVEADLKRLSLANQLAIFDDKDAAYAASLQALESDYSAYPVAALISYYKAAFTSSTGMQWRPGMNEAVRLSLKSAHETCTKVTKQWPGTEGDMLCRSLISSLERKEIRVMAEASVQPSVPALLSLEYRNVGTVYLRSVKINRALADEITTYRRSTEKLVEELVSLPPVQEWTAELPQDGDLQSHRTELKVPPLEKGVWAILVSSGPDFGSEKEYIGWAVVQSSRIAFISRSDQGKIEFYVADRESGNPLRDVKAELSTMFWDYKSSSYAYRSLGTGSTDQQGFITFSRSDTEGGNLRITLEQGGESLVSQVYGYYGYYREQRETQTRFFTDRAIYRPGQTVYFKGIMMITGRDKMPELVRNQRTEVFFSDANGKVVSKQTLTTGDFGSFNGSFTAPNGVLNGQMSIRNESGSVFFRVEEYKRPNFEVTFPPAEGSWRLNDTVSVKGTALSYAGAPLAGATVVWKVVRRASYSGYFPFYRYFWWDGKVASIARGVSESGADGSFTINFPLKPDNQIPKEDLPLFNYTITADVTDINGETHSATTVIPAGYTSLTLAAAGPNELTSGAALTLTLASTNLAGTPEPASGTITISRLTEPKRLLRKRLFETPDRPGIACAEFAKLFPRYPCGGEDDPAKQSPEKQVFSGSFNTATQKELVIPATTGWQAGTYRIEMKAADKYGAPVQSARDFTVHAAGEGAAQVNKRLWLSAGKSSVEAGETLDLVVGTAAEQSQVIVDILRKNGQERKVIALSKGQKRIAIPVTAEDRGGMAVRYGFIKHGDADTGMLTIEVPWSDKELTATFLSFRDKTEPGAKEEWRLQITGADKAAREAEIAATLYDASLDSFIPHNWDFSVFPYRSFNSHWQKPHIMNPVHFMNWERSWNTYISAPSMQNDMLNLFGLGYGYYRYQSTGYKGGLLRTREARTVDAGVLQEQVMPAAAVADEAESSGEGRVAKKMKAKEESVAFEGDASVTGRDKNDNARNREAAKPIQIRKNLVETAFFYPDLKTDSAGNVIIRFTMPEALTRWKLLGLAHTKALDIAQFSKETVTQKTIMVTPNLPRFFREGDEITITAKIASMADAPLSGNATLKLFDAKTMQPIDQKFGLQTPAQPFSLSPKGSGAAAWKLTVPKGVDAVNVRLIAEAGDKGDGEERVVPVLSNRMLVTESLPLHVKGGAKKEFAFKKLLDSGNSKTMANHRLTLEFSSNPAWYAVQALPYLMEFPHECAEQVFSRFYANMLAQHITAQTPRIKEVFELWRNTPALESNLAKNEELKLVLLQETPWVLEAQQESEAKKRIALLFDLNKMALELNNALDKLIKMQTVNGGWPWFPGLPEDPYITQHIVGGMAKLKKLGILLPSSGEQSLKRAIPFIDREMYRSYRNLIEWKADLSKEHIGPFIWHYLYVRSLVAEVPVAENYSEAFTYWKGQAATYWVGKHPQLMAYGALALARFKEGKTAAKIMESLSERAIHSEELGMYWKENMGSFYWYEFPIETQAVLIEAYDELVKKQAVTDELRTWLLKMKQVQNWKTTKATADACYALLKTGSDWLSDTTLADITMGGEKMQPEGGISKAEAGTGYFKIAKEAAAIKPAYGNVTVKNPNKSAAWGALYWQYYEDMDKITPHETPLKLERLFFKERQTDRGATLEPLQNGTPLKVGDRLIVRLTLRIDRDIDYLHLRDQRPSGTEPEQTLSRGFYRDGLWYYQVTKDASTNFFIHRAPKGTFVFEYPLRANLAGHFSAGIAEAQCMYAPEFTAHSGGVVLDVTGK